MPLGKRGVASAVLQKCARTRLRQRSLASAKWAVAAGTHGTSGAFQPLASTDRLHAPDTHSFETAHLRSPRPFPILPTALRPAALRPPRRAHSSKSSAHAVCSGSKVPSAMTIRSRAPGLGHARGGTLEENHRGGPPTTPKLCPHGAQMAQRRRASGERATPMRSPSGTRAARACARRAHARPRGVRAAPTRYPSGADEALEQTRATREQRASGSRGDRETRKKRLMDA